MTLAKPTESILDLIVGPSTPGQTFLGGICVTHDCNEFFLTDHLASVLTSKGAQARKGTKERRKAVLTVPVPDNGRLLVLSARIATNTFGPLLPPWLDHVQVGGRRLHSKFGLLAFREGERGAIRIRSYVTSANLTTGGAFRNRELIYAEQSQGRSGPLLARELRLVLDQFREALVLETGEAKAVAALDRALKMRWMPDAVEPRSTRIVHSLDQPRDLVASALTCRGTKKATRVVVVSPPFGRNDAGDAAAAIRPHLRSAAGVEIVTERAGKGRAVFPLGVFDDAEFSTVDPMDKIAARGRPTEERKRMLHAKLYAFRWGGNEADLLIGSANLTESALLPRGHQNRELLIRLGVQHAAHDEFLEAWGEANGVLPAPKTLKAPVESIPPRVLPAPEIEAVFHFPAGAACTSEQWTGTLELTFAGAPPVRIQYQGRKVEPVAEQAFTLHACPRFLTAVSADDREVAVPISVRPAEDDAGFWHRTKSIESDPEEVTFLEWLGKVSRGQDSDAAPTGAKPTSRGSKTADDDKIAFPLKNALSVFGRVVRNRPDYVRGLPAARLRQIRTAILTSTEEAERRSAEAVLDAVIAGIGQGRDEPRKNLTGLPPLLSILTSWIASMKKAEQ
jgi:hypothetical protein